MSQWNLREKIVELLLFFAWELKRWDGSKEGKSEGSSAVLEHLFVIMSLCNVAGDLQQFVPAME